ncbi:hypothetical protein G6F57_015262 [Rhizopus arrhizus]|nr:hypothetical protein G6F57_015262 [Rhizopus arrhizus]
MQSVARVGSGQGVAFLVTPPALELPVAVEENCVLFDRIQDPGNVGTLLRTCAAAGVKRVFLATGTAAAWSPKVVRSGQGAHFALAIHEHVDLAGLLPRRRVPWVATALDGAQNLARRRAGAAGRGETESLDSPRRRGGGVLERRRGGRHLPVRATAASVGRTCMKAFGSLIPAACLAALLGACASTSPVSAVFVPVVASEASSVSQLSRDVIAHVPDGEAYTLPEGSRWRRVGALVQGDVYRPLGEPLRVGKRGGSDAYLLASSGKLLGFYLPSGSMFMPLNKPVVLPFYQRQ